MTYDLRRLRLKGIIYRLEHSNRYIVTKYGYRVAYVMSKINARLFRPINAVLNTANQEKIPNLLVEAFKKVDQEIENIFTENNLKPVA